MPQVTLYQGHNALDSIVPSDHSGILAPPPRQGGSSTGGDVPIIVLVILFGSSLSMSLGFYFIQLHIISGDLILLLICK